MALALASTLGCGAGDTSPDTNDPDPTAGENVSVTLRGSVEKGPFVLGSTVRAAPLDGLGSPTGLQFDAATANDLGEFTINNIPTGPVALEASGFHWNEATATLSGAALTLRAVHETTGGEEVVHINALTHLMEPRARALMANGVAPGLAITQAQTELIAGLEFGAPGLVIDVPVWEMSLVGQDTVANAYLLGVSVAFAHLAIEANPDAVDAELQQSLNTVAADLADDGALTQGIRDQLDLGESLIDVHAVAQGLGARLAELGLPASVPDMHRVLDQDHDGIANIAEDHDNDGAHDFIDNCPTLANADQQDVDGDGRGVPCDNCPSHANEMQEDSDLDGIGNLCDSCPLSSGPGEVPGENCCDPRSFETCTKTWPGSNIFQVCLPADDIFECEPATLGVAQYGEPCLLGCNLCAPSGALNPLASCNGGSCYCDGKCCSKFCTVGDNSACSATPGVSCIAWYPNGQAPAGLETLGVCAKADDGPCAGLSGVECF